MDEEQQTPRLSGRGVSVCWGVQGPTLVSRIAGKSLRGFLDSAQFLHESARPKVEVQSTSDVLTTLDNCALSMFGDRVAAMPARFDNVASGAAELCEPQAQFIQVPRRTLKTDEEIDACDAEGIEWTIVPGLTSASMAAARLGQSLTKRGRNTEVRFLTGHGVDGVDHEVDEGHLELVRDAEDRRQRRPEAPVEELVVSPHEGTAPGADGQQSGSAIVLRRAPVDQAQPLELVGVPGGGGGADPEKIGDLAHVALAVERHDPQDVELRERQREGGGFTKELQFEDFPDRGGEDVRVPQEAPEMVPGGPLFAAPSGWGPPSPISSVVALPPMS